MVDSRTLQLLNNVNRFNDQIVAYLSRRLVGRGYLSVTPSVLSFLGVLECGVNHGSEIARTLRVSRQMVAKTVKEMGRLGYLEQVEGSGRQKQILFTEAGERLMADARQVLAEVDEVLSGRLGDAQLSGLIAQLQAINSLLDEGLDA